MKICIVGGSIGGLSAAIALRKEGCEVVVLERASKIVPAGAVRLSDHWPTAGNARTRCRTDHAAKIILCARGICRYHAGTRSRSNHVRHACRGGLCRSTPASQSTDSDWRVQARLLTAMSLLGRLAVCKSHATQGIKPTSSALNFSASCKLYCDFVMQSCGPRGVPCKENSYSHHCQWCAQSQKVSPYSYPNFLILLNIRRYNLKWLLTWASSYRAQWSFKLASLEHFVLQGSVHKLPASIPMTM